MRRDTISQFVSFLEYNPNAFSKGESITQQSGYAVIIEIVVFFLLFLFTCCFIPMYYSYFVATMVCLYTLCNKLLNKKNLRKVDQYLDSCLCFCRAHGIKLRCYLETNDCQTILNTEFGRFLPSLDLRLILYLTLTSERLFTTVESLQSYLICQIVKCSSYYYFIYSVLYLNKKVDHH